MSNYFFIKTRTIHFVVVVTTIAAALGVIADLCLLLYAYRNNPQLPFLSGMPASILAAGSVLGMVAIFIYMMGSAALVFYAFRRSFAGKIYVIFSTFTMAVAMVAHTKMATMISVCVDSGSIEIFSPCSLEGPGAPAHFVLFLLLGSLAMSAVFSLAIINRGTVFPRFMAVLNPAVLMLLLTLICLNFGLYAQPFVFAVPSITVFIYTLLLDYVMQFDLQA